MSKYRCIGGEADGEFIRWSGTPAHHVVVEFYRQDMAFIALQPPESPVTDRAIRRCTYWFQQWRDDDRKRWYLIPYGQDGFDMLDHLIKKAYIE